MALEDLPDDPTPDPDPILARRRRQRRERTRQRLLAAGGMLGLIVLSAVSFEMGRLSKGDGGRATDPGPSRTSPASAPSRPAKRPGPDGLNQQMKDVFNLGQDLPATSYGKDPAAGAANRPNTPPLFDERNPD